MPDRITIVGDGQMALVLADVLCKNGAEVLIWGPFATQVNELSTTRQSARLPRFTLNASVGLTDDDASALAHADLIVNAIPTQFVRSVWERLQGGYRPHTPIVCVSKGIENETLLRPTEVMRTVIAEVRGPDTTAAEDFCALSGPTIAAELARRLPAAMLAASQSSDLSQAVQERFTVPWLRVYRSDDIVGVELAGAAKNVIALAAGMIDGIGAGDNAKSALLARGLAEISRLGVAMGATPETFFGIAGVGDLATTCFSPCGRNRTCGERLGKGESLDEIIASTLSVVEGVPTAKSIVALMERYDVDMPITEAVHAILFERLAVRDAISQLMSRELKAESLTRSA